MIKLLALTLPLALVAACSSGGADADGNGQISNDEASAEAANVRLDPGQWRMTVALTGFEAPGLSDQERSMMQGMFNGEHSQEQCITPEQASAPQAELFGGAAQENCRYTEFSMSGGHMNVAGSCAAPEGQGASTMHMQGTYTSAGYDMTMETVTTGTDKGDITMNAHVTGERIGDCPAAGADNDAAPTGDAGDAAN